MKHLLATLLVGGAVVAGALATAAPASATCYNDPDGIMVHIPTACVGYDHCDADICIQYPWSVDAR